MNGEAKISVFDLNGKVMYNSEREIYAEQIIPLNTEEWAAGVYLVSVQVGERKITSRLVVAH